MKCIAEDGFPTTPRAYEILGVIMSLSTWERLHPDMPPPAYVVKRDGRLEIKTKVWHIREDQHRCATCGADTGEEFTRTGKPHMCKGEGNETNRKTD